MHSYDSIVCLLMLLKLGIITFIIIVGLILKIELVFLCNRLEAGWDVTDCYCCNLIHCLCCKHFLVTLKHPMCKNFSRIVRCHLNSILTNRY